VRREDVTTPQGTAGLTAAVCAIFAQLRSRRSLSNANALSPLVATDWLAAHLEEADLRIFDCSVTLVPVESGVRPESGRAAGAAGHIPGSAFADLIADLSDRSHPLPFMMPPATQFAEVMRRYSVGTRVVLYDSGGHMWATRVWWMLRAMGLDDAAVLDGGLTKWKAQGRPRSTEAVRYPATKFAPHPRAELFVGKQTVKDSLGASAVGTLRVSTSD
jgi:thiosulfate/3-mercaptopyruvate sulfurtransferase